MREKKRKKTVVRASVEKRSSRIKRFFRRIFYSFFTIIALVVLNYIFVFPSLLSNEGNTENIVIVSEKLDVPSNSIYFAHVTGSEDKNTVFSIPAEVELEVPNGYGEYALQSVYQLLKIDKKDDQFIRATYSEILGFAIDEVVTINAQLNHMEEAELKTFFLRKSFENLYALNLTNVYEPFSLHFKFKNMNYSQLESVEELLDYKDTITTVTGKVYQYCSVAVINASDVNGLARKRADEIEKTGALVVRVDDTQDKHENAKIYYGQDPVDCEPLAKKISNIFYEKPEMYDLSELENAQQYRSKVVVIVGE